MISVFHCAKEVPRLCTSVSGKIREAPRSIDIRFQERDEFLCFDDSIRAVDRTRYFWIKVVLQRPLALLDLVGYGRLELRQRR